MYQVDAASLAAVVGSGWRPWLTGSAALACAKAAVLPGRGWRSGRARQPLAAPASRGGVSFAAYVEGVRGGLAVLVSVSSPSRGRPLDGDTRSRRLVLRRAALGSAPAPVAPATWNRCVAAPDNFYDWAIEEGLVERSPFSYRFVIEAARDRVRTGGRRHQARERTGRAHATVTLLEGLHTAVHRAGAGRSDGRSR